MNTKLVLLIVSLPPNPSSLRVRVWRRLRAIGAVALKRTVYLLPDSPDHYEHFQWLAQEIQRAGGEATLLRVEQIENMSSEEVVQLFHEVRSSEYRRLGGRYRKLLQTLDRKSAATNPRVQAELARLQRDYEKQFSVADRKSTRLNSSHLVISYAVFCLKKKKQKNINVNNH